LNHENTDFLRVAVCLKKVKGDLTVARFDSWSARRDALLRDPALHVQTTMKVGEIEANDK
jgi:hypothetical protein